MVIRWNETALLGKVSEKGEGGALGVGFVSRKFDWGRRRGGKNVKG